MDVKINISVLSIVEGDITGEKPTPSSTLQIQGWPEGGGVDGAIHRAGGPSIMEEAKNTTAVPLGKQLSRARGNSGRNTLYTPLGPFTATVRVAKRACSEVLTSRASDWPRPMG